MEINCDFCLLLTLISVKCWLPSTAKPPVLDARRKEDQHVWSPWQQPWQDLSAIVPSWFLSCLLLCKPRGQSSSSGIQLWETNSRKLLPRHSSNILLFSQKCMWAPGPHVCKVMLCSGKCGSEACWVGRVGAGEHHWDISCLSPDILCLCSCFLVSVYSHGLVRVPQSHRKGPWSASDCQRQWKGVSSSAWRWIIQTEKEKSNPNRFNTYIFRRFRTLSL